MKRVNKEHITEVLNGYMKRRNFTGIPSDSNRVPVSMVSSAVSMVSSLESSALGTVTCASVADSTSSDYELQFNRLVVFVKDADEKHKPSLINILFPMFVSIYVDMMVGELKSIANRFHQNNKNIFCNLPTYRETMEKISSVVQKCDKDRSKSLSKVLHSELGELKYSISFTPDTLSYLTSYLSRGSNSMILQVFNANIAVEITTDSSLEPIYSKIGKDNFTESSSEAMERLKSAIVAMQGVAPPQPSIRLHTINSQYPGLVCGHITPRYLVLGCQDSSLRIFSRTGGQNKRKSSLECKAEEGESSYQFTISTVPLQGDFLEDMEDCAKLNHTAQYNTLRGHSSTVYSIANFDDSDYIISGSADKSIRLWDSENLVNKVIYRGHTLTVWSLATAHSSSYFVSCSKDRSAKLWTTECTYPLRSYIGHTMSVDCVKFHPNNSYIATASQDRTIRLWSVQEGKCVRLMQGHRGSILSIAFSPTGLLLASAGEDRKIRLWDLASGDLIKEMRGHTDTVKCLEFNQDGSLLCSGSQDNTILTWDTRTTHSSHSVNSLGSPQTGMPPTPDLLATYYTADSSIVSIQRQNYGIMEVIGAT